MDWLRHPAVGSPLLLPGVTGRTRHNSTSGRARVRAFATPNPHQLIGFCLPVDHRVLLRRED